MIVPFKSGGRSLDEYVICPRVPVTVAELRDRMLQRAKVSEGSYAFQLIDDLHAAIFLRSLDLKADYEMYFIKEYESLDSYLRRRARIPSAVVATLTRAIGEYTGMYHFRPVYDFLGDSYGLEFLTKLLEDLPPGEDAS